MEQGMNREKRKILVVDDEKNFMKLLEHNLNEEGYMVDTASSGEEALTKMDLKMPDLILTDLKMPGVNGMEILRRAKEINKSIPVIMITGHGDTGTAVEAMKLGAYDFITKPLRPNELLVTARNALNSRVLIDEVTELRSQLETRYDFKNIIGSSVKMQNLFKIMTNAIGSSVTVLIQGESGTGKELVARAIHYNGPRKNGPFIVVNCAAIPETLLESELFGHERGAFTGAFERRIGKFEQADRGTIFLDEIGEMSAPIQAKVLRVLESKEVERIGGNERINVDVRIISATNKDLLSEVGKGSFRKDLYYRLAVFPINLPPLRERKEDIPMLVSHFIRLDSADSKKEVKHITKGAIEALMSFSWPGNIRELENVIERAVVLCEGDTIQEEHLPLGMEVLSEKIPDKMETLINTSIIISLNDLEADAIKRALVTAEHNISKAAKELGIGRATFYRKAKKIGIL
jgi:DNA-binding NtrC family response regulator